MLESDLVANLKTYRSFLGVCSSLWFSLFSSVCSLSLSMVCAADRLALEIVLDVALNVFSHDPLHKQLPQQPIFFLEQPQLTLHLPALHLHLVFVAFAPDLSDVVTSDDSADIVR